MPTGLAAGIPNSHRLREEFQNRLQLFSCPYDRQAGTIWIRTMDGATYWTNCRFPSSSGCSAAECPWVLCHSEHGGYSAFASRSFSAGEVILVERPLTCIEAHHPFSPEDVAEIERRVALLDDSDRGAFYALSNVFEGDEGVTVCAGIYMTNCFDMTGSGGSDEGHRACAMYPAIARLNHSCVPNVQQTHLPDTGEEVLIASRSISAGEELNDCYIDLRADRHSRRRLLKELYRFDCCCAACSLPAGPLLAADDRARCRALELDDHVVAAAETSAVTALDIASDLVRLLEAPSSSGWSARYVAGAYVSKYLLSSALGDSRAARKNLQSAHSYNCLLQGEASPDAKHTLALLQALR